eukprot:6432149-Prymnesium_polylepis.1
MVPGANGQLSGVKRKTKPLEVTVDDDESAKPFKLTIPAGEVGCVAELAETVAMEVEIATGKACAAAELSLQARAESTNSWVSINDDADIALWVRAKQRRVRREGRAKMLKRQAKEKELGRGGRGKANGGNRGDGGDADYGEEEDEEGGGRVAGKAAARGAAKPKPPLKPPPAPPAPSMEAGVRSRVPRPRVGTARGGTHT